MSLKINDRNQTKISSLTGQMNLFCVLFELSSFRKSKRSFAALEIYCSLSSYRE